MQFIACREHLVKYRLTPASMSKSGKRMWDAANTILKRYSAPTQIRLASQYWGGVGVSLEIGKGTTPDVRSVLEESLGMHGPAPDYRRFAQGFLDGITRATGKTDLLSDELAVVCPDLCRLGLVAETEYHLPGLLYALVQIMLTKEAMKKVEESCRQAEEFRQQADESRRQAEEFRREAIRLTRMVEAYKTSRSYRIGRVITRMWPFPAWKPKSR
jgi:hypothetical protein